MLIQCALATPLESQRCPNPPYLYIINSRPLFFEVTSRVCKSIGSFYSVTIFMCRRCSITIPQLSPQSPRPAGGFSPLPPQTMFFSHRHPLLYPCLQNPPLPFPNPPRVSRCLPPPAVKRSSLLGSWKLQVEVLQQCSPLLPQRVLPQGIWVPGFLSVLQRVNTLLVESKGLVALCLLASCPVVSRKAPRC